MAKETTKEEVVADVAEATGEIPSITAGDLTVMVRIIDAGSKRGAWNGDELSAIGELRNKLAAVVRAVTPEESVEESVEESETEEEATESAA